MDCHFLGEASAFVRRIQFELQPAWIRFHFEVYVGHQTHIIANGQFQERLVRNWCVIVRVIPLPKSLPGLRPTPVAKL